MATTTYLDAVNEVLIRLRENEVSTTEGTYAKLIGRFVDRGMEWVESKYDWQILRQTTSITTEAGTPSYVLQNSKRNGRLYMEYRGGSYMPLVYNTTSGSEGWLAQAPKSFYWESQKGVTIQTGKPTWFTPLDRDQQGNIIVGFVDEPDGVYVIDFEVIKTSTRFNDQAASTRDEQIFQCPAQPAIEYAYALAIAERGEDGGQSVGQVMQIASSLLAEAIAADTSWDPEQMVMRVE